jgi:hypothetical protein
MVNNYRFELKTQVMYSQKNITVVLKAGVPYLKSSNLKAPLHFINKAPWPKEVL